MSGGRSLAVAMIRHRPAGGQHACRQARTALQNYAALEGYDVAELFEAFGSAPVEHATMDVIIDLADRFDARTVLTFGDIGTENLNRLASRSDLRVVPVPEERNTPTAPRGIGVSQTPAGRVSDIITSKWTGRLEIELLNDAGRLVTTLELVIRIDSLTLWSGNRTLAVIDRDRFRHWVFHPDQMLQIDDVTCWAHQGLLWCSVDGSVPYALRAETSRRLLSVV